MWDIVGAKPLWFQEWHVAGDVELDQFAWNKDGTAAAVVSDVSSGVVDTAHPELWLVSDTGDAQRLASLNNGVAGTYSIVSPTWSPDEKQVAFILTSDQSFHVVGYTGVVAVVNITTRAVTDYCVGPVQWAHGLVWSPDSQQLTFITQSSRLTVLDIPNSQVQLVYQMPDDRGAAIEGWTLYPIN